jgi:hypothetical protein
MPLTLALTIPGWVIFALALVATGLLVLIVILKASFRTNAKPTFTQLPEDAPMPPALAQALQSWQGQLLQLGYTREGLIASDDVQPNSSMVLALFAHRKEQTMAMIASLENRVNTQTGERVIAQTYAEFSTEMASGASILTGNGNEIAFGPRTPDKITLVIPGVDVLTLHRVHLRAVSLHGPIKPHDWSLTMPQLCQLAIDRFIERGVRHGYLTPPRDGHARLTWKGAVIGLFTNIPPGKQLWRSSGLRPGKELLAQVANG